MAKKNKLGMGMDSLFFDNESESAMKQTLKISQLEPNKKQPRTDFDDESLATLADSIRQHGVLQPLLVRPTENGMYQIVAGERRWRAARMSGISEVPVLIKELDDKQTMQIGLIENLQRENLNPIEEALGYQELMETYEMTQESVAKTVGKSRSAVANTLRTLKLCDEIKEMLRAGNLTVGHAKALAGMDNEFSQLQVARKATAGNLSVRATENLCKKIQNNTLFKMGDPDLFGAKTYFKEVELALQKDLGRKVKVLNKDNKGILEIEFYGEEDLNAIATLLTKVNS